MTILAILACIWLACCSGIAVWAASAGLALVRPNDPAHEQIKAPTSNDTAAALAATLVRVECKVDAITGGDKAHRVAA